MKDWMLTKDVPEAMYRLLVHLGCGHTTYGRSCNRDSDGWYCGWCHAPAPEEWGFVADLANCWHNPWRMKRPK